MRVVWGHGNLGKRKEASMEGRQTLSLSPLLQLIQFLSSFFFASFYLFFVFLPSCVKFFPCFLFFCFFFFLGGGVAFCLLLFLPDYCSCTCNLRSLFSLILKQRSSSLFILFFLSIVKDNKFLLHKILKLIILNYKKLHSYCINS